MNLIKEHYIIKNENDDIVYDFLYNVSSRGYTVRNSYIFKNRKFIKLDTNISKSKILLSIKRDNENDSDSLITIHLTNTYQKNFISTKRYRKKNMYLVKYNSEDLENKLMKYQIV